MKICAKNICFGLATVLMLWQPPLYAEVTLLTPQPETMVSNEPTSVTFVAEIAPNPKLIESSVNLLRQTPNGTKVVGRMHDDGKQGDVVANDHQYSLSLTLNEEVSGPIFFQASAAYKGALKRELSMPTTLQINLACGPTGTILPVKIFEITANSLNSETVDFEVPRGGQAVLRLINGARINATVAERIAEAKILLNGDTIKTMAKNTNTDEMLIELQSGHNEFGIEKLVGKTGQRLSAQINVCADTLKLKPITDTQKVGNTLNAEATISGLGIPIENARIQFELLDFGIKQDSIVLTSNFGNAVSTFNLPATVGSGSLRATLIDAKPFLIDEIPINSIENLSIVLGQGKSDVTINIQESSYTPFFIYYKPSTSANQHIEFTQTISPLSEGISLLTENIPDGGFVATGPNIFSIEENIRGITPGNYEVTSTATIKETGETISSILRVKVLDPSTPEPLILGTPTASPTAASLSSQILNITFMSLVSGTTSPPSFLILDEVDENGNLLAEAIGQLKDDGQAPDKTSSDYAYTGSVKLDISIEGEHYYRVRAEYFSNQEISGNLTFGVTPFSVELRESDPATLIEDLENGGQIYANEVIVQFIPGVNSMRINEIAAATGTTVIDAIPALRSYLLETPENDSFSRLKQTIAALKAFSEVGHAFVNERPFPLTFPFSAPQDTLFNNQWYLTTIGAQKTWQIGGGGDAAHSVAVIDYGIDCNHVDLGIDITSTPEREGACALSDSAVNPHATELAGIIAAKTDNSEGIAGLAFKSRLYDYPISSNHTMAGRILDAITNSDVKIINISQAVQSNPPELGTAISNAIDNGNGRLIVVASGNPSKTTYANCQQPNLYPASLASNYPNGLLVVGATDENDFLATGYDAFGTPNHCSNRTNVGLYAPGKNIWTTNSGAQPYTAVSGTSFATALTSASAAVLWASNLSPTNAQAVKSRLTNKADIISLGNGFASGPRLNLFAAVATQKVRVNFKYDGADYRNIFGYYFKDPSNSPKEAHILLDNVDVATNSTLCPNNQPCFFQKDIFLTNQQLNNLEFFIIPGGNGSASGGDNIDINGYNTDNINFFNQSTLPTDRNLLVFLDSDNNWRVKDTRDDNNPNNDIILRGVHNQTISQISDAFFSESDKNPGSTSNTAIPHFRKLSPTSYNSNLSCNPNQVPTDTTSKLDFIMCWEDLDEAFSDHDFDDAIFNLSATPQ